MIPKFHIIIPARYHSSRLPGKLMLKIEGLSILQRTYQQALKSNAQSVTIATDHDLIAKHAKAFGAFVKMTSTSHQSGSDRIAEVIAQGNFKPNDIIVNLQGDEPFIAPELISQLTLSLHNSQNPLATLCWPLDNPQQLHNPNVVKVVRDRWQNALYFSRSAIPANRDEPKSIQQVFRHIGLYAYRASFLLDFVKWPVCELEACEALEQLRILWQGYKIKVEEACIKPLQDINSYEDLQLARMLIKSSFPPVQ